MFETLPHESPISILIRQRPNQIIDMSSGIHSISAPSIQCHDSVSRIRKLGTYAYRPLVQPQSNNPTICLHAGILVSEQLGGAFDRNQPRRLSQTMAAYRQPKMTERMKCCGHPTSLRLRGSARALHSGDRLKGIYSPNHPPAHRLARIRQTRCRQQS